MQEIMLFNRQKVILWGRIVVMFLSFNGTDRRISVEEHHGETVYQVAANRGMRRGLPRGDGARHRQRGNDHPLGIHRVARGTVTGGIAWGSVALIPGLMLLGCSPSGDNSADRQLTITEEGTVTAVVDGDTIDVTTPDGDKLRVRLIGIDAPEIGRDGAASDCYAEEARAFVDELLYGHEVMLMTDDTQGDVDKYGRLLRYVIIDEHLAEDIIIGAGYAREYTYDKPYVHRDSHVAGETAAQIAEAGLWGHC